MASNFVMYAGDDKTLQVRVTDPDGEAVNLTAAAIKWQCARSLGKASVIFKSTSSGITLTDPADGQFEVTLEDGDTEDLAGTYQHEAQVTFSDGTISTVLSGTMKVIPVVIEAT